MLCLALYATSRLANAGSLAACAVRRTFYFLNNARALFLSFSSTTTPFVRRLFFLLLLGCCSASSCYYVRSCQSAAFLFLFSLVRVQLNTIHRKWTTHSNNFIWTTLCWHLFVIAILISSDMVPIDIVTCALTMALAYRRYAFTFPGICFICQIDYCWTAF